MEGRSLYRCGPAFPGCFLRNQFSCEHEYRLKEVAWGHMFLTASSWSFLFCRHVSCAHSYSSQNRLEMSTGGFLSIFIEMDQGLSFYFWNIVQLFLNARSYGFSGVVLKWLIQVSCAVYLWKSTLGSPRWEIFKKLLIWCTFYLNLFLF